MPIAFLLNARRTAARASRRILNNSQGIAAVEFGFIAPIMLLMLLGTIEISRAITIDRRFGLATAMIADLITRERDIVQDGANILNGLPPGGGDDANPNDGIYGVVRHVMGPYDNGTLKISVIPVKADPNDETNTKVYAATDNRPALGGGVEELAYCTPYTLSDNLLSKGASVIVVKTSYEFRPILVDYVIGGTTWTDTATLAPRNNCVDFDGDECVSGCFP